jgi:hypothetical protein
MDGLTVGPAHDDAGGLLVVDRGTVGSRHGSIIGRRPLAATVRCLCAGCEYLYARLSQKRRTAAIHVHLLRTRLGPGSASCAAGTRSAN